jgi:light-regulated signal transduction histidine kinase (bacteriophytochrome)
MEPAANRNDATPQSFQVGLDNCDREPIRIPNLIQPFGVLLAVDDDGRIVQCSDNASDLGLDPQDLPGQRLADAIGEPAAQAVQQATQSDMLAAGRVRVATTPIGGRPCDVMAHRNPDNGPQTLVEVEFVQEGAALPGRPPAAVDGFDAVREAMLAFAAARDVETLCDAIAGHVQRITGYDRVMVYRFDRDYNGQVIAEAVGPDASGLDSFLGLHYPASDIPKQARSLYLRNWLRLIPDVAYRPARLVPEDNPIVPQARLEPTATGEVVNLGRRLDLGLAELRSVSPLHVEYLQNMGVTATMTVSLLEPDDKPEPHEAARTAAGDGARLWGLIACHHYSGVKHLDFATRSVCEVIGQVASTQIIARSTASHQAEVADRRGTLQTLVRELSLPDSDFVHALTRGRPSVLDLMDCCGAAVLIHGELQTVGEVPAEPVVRDVAAWATARVPEADIPEPGRLGALLAREIQHTDRLGEVAADLGAPPACAAGVMTVALSATGDALMWFRPELVRTVTWGGNPQKAVRAVEEDGSVRLSPRKSFAKWRSQLEGRCKPWTAADIAAAKEVRDALVGVVMSRLRELGTMNARLEASNAELDSFAYVASHDLREPLRGIHNLASFVVEDQGDRLDDEGRRHLAMMQRLARRMDSLVASLLEYSRVGRLELERVPLDWNRLFTGVREALSARLAGEPVVLDIAPDLPAMEANPPRLAEVFQNLISNAVKYNLGEVKRVEVIWDADHPDVPVGDLSGRKAVALGVRDNGIGIDPRNHQDVFRIFRRLHADKDFGGGAGAGLTIAKRVVERHGGRIWIESDPSRPGTTFWFTLDA